MCVQRGGRASTEDASSTARRFARGEDMETQQLSSLAPFGSQIERYRVITQSAPTAAPAPLGLLGFSVATLVAASTKLGLNNPGTSSLMAVISMTFGGLVQIIAGWLCYFKNNTFGFVTFMGFGFHWFMVGLAGTLELQGIYAPTSSYKDLFAVYFGIWTAFSIVMTLATFNINRVLTVTMICITLVFGFDMGSDYFDWAQTTSGVFAVMAVIGAMWLFTADFLNEIFGRIVIPIFPVESHKDDFTEKIEEYMPRLHYHKVSSNDTHSVFHPSTFAMFTDRIFVID